MAISKYSGSRLLLLSIIQELNSHLNSKKKYNEFEKQPNETL